MNMYTVLPTPDNSGWLVKLEDVAPDGQYQSEDEALNAAKEMAKNNTPSVVKILDKDHNVQEEIKF